LPITDMIQRRHRFCAPNGSLRCEPANKSSGCKMPIELTDQEKDLLLELAMPIAYGQRSQFLREVAAALEAFPQRQSGPGTTFRIAREVQRRFVLEARRVAPEREMPRA
jgi:hypothetical protein